MTQVSRKGFRDKNGKQVAIVPKVPGATSGNLAGFDSHGNLTDSSKKPSDFAPKDYIPVAITNEPHPSLLSGVYCLDNGAVAVQTRVEFGVSLEQQHGPSKYFSIDNDTIDNLNRASQDPDASPTEGSDKLIKSGAVYKAIQDVLKGSVKEGLNTGAVGDASHAEGERTIAAGDHSHAEGFVEKDTSRDHIVGLVVLGNPTEDTVVNYKKIVFEKASDYSGTIEDFASVGDVVFYEDIVTGNVSYGKIEDIDVLAGDPSKFVYTLSHEVKVNVTDNPLSEYLYKAHVGAFGNNSHVEGMEATAIGDNSHAEGIGTVAKGDNQHVQGAYNVIDTNEEHAFIIGNGTDNTHRSNLLAVSKNGAVSGSAVDSTPTANSSKMVTSGGVKAALDGKANSSHGHNASDISGLPFNGLHFFVMDSASDYVDMDELFTPEGFQTMVSGTKNVIVENSTSSIVDLGSFFTSQTSVPVHTNQDLSDTTIEVGGYALCTIYLVNKLEDVHEHTGYDFCYFVVLEQVFTD